jgi:hypothetical protein
MIVENKAENPEQKGFRELLTIINLCEDALDEVAIHLPPDLREMKSVKILDENAIWQNADYTLSEDGIILNHELGYCKPTFLKIV